MTSPQSRQDLAESLFAAWLTRREAGANEPLDDLLEQHPGVRDELVGLHDNWKLFDPILSKLVGSFADDPHGLALDTDDAQAASQLREKLGVLTPAASRYRFRGEVGRGGCGVVLKVWDSKLKRTVAMKLALAARDGRRVEHAALTRFVDEARIASQLSHPGIVPVYDLGADEEGRPYFTMKLVKGVELTRIFEQVRERSNGWNPTRALALLLRVCEAMTYAHDRGVIHRDLKPANVMVGPYGEIYVMDWGLARVLSAREGVAKRPASEAITEVESFRRTQRERDPASHLLTQSDTGIGTLCYMPPEQARGDLAAVGPRSDVYAVGAMLYHLLAGAPPFLESGVHIDRELLLLSVLRGTPTPIAQLAPKLPRELHAICERAMARDPAERYASMKELADDLQAYLERRVVRAYRSNAWDRTWKWVRRNPGLAAGVAVGLTGLLGGSGAVKAVQAVFERREFVRESTRRLEEFETRAKNTQYGSDELAGRHYRWWLDECGSLLGVAQASTRPTIEQLQEWTNNTWRSALEGISPLPGAQLAELSKSSDHTMRTLQRLSSRYARVLEIEARVTFAKAWTEAAKSIANSPAYGGLQLAPQVELMPLDPDPDSGLWRFAHFTSGDIPARDNDGRLRRDAQSCVIFILVPASLAPNRIPFFLATHLATTVQVANLYGRSSGPDLGADCPAPVWYFSRTDAMAVCKAGVNWFDLPTAEELYAARAAHADLELRIPTDASPVSLEWTRDTQRHPEQGELGRILPLSATPALEQREGRGPESLASNTADPSPEFLPIDERSRGVGFRLRRAVLN